MLFQKNETPPVRTILPNLYPELVHYHRDKRWPQISLEWAQVGTGFHPLEFPSHAQKSWEPDRLALNSLPSLSNNAPGQELEQMDNVGQLQKMNIIKLKLKY